MSRTIRKSLVDKPNRKFRRQNRVKSSIAQMGAKIVTHQRIAASPFPPVLRRTLRYCDNYLMTSTIGAPVVQQWKVNSLFDPDSTGSGHQPRFYDQLCAAAGPYATYRVLRSRIRLLTTKTDALYAYSFSAGYSDVSSIPSGGPGITPELPGWKGWAMSSIDHTREMLFESPISVVNSVPEATVMADDRFAAAYNSDPADISWFTIQFAQPGGSTAVAFITAELEFDVQFEDPILVATS